jgi:hypothetical protein
MPYFDPSQDPAEKKAPVSNHAHFKHESPSDLPVERPGVVSDAPVAPPIPLTPETLTFRDETGAIWWAHEVSGEALGSKRPFCLLFISGTKLRRVWTYPANWRSLTPAELLALAQSGE